MVGDGSGFEEDEFVGSVLGRGAPGNLTTHRAKDPWNAKVSSATKGEKHRSMKAECLIFRVATSAESRILPERDALRRESASGLHREKLDDQHGDGEQQYDDGEWHKS